jgi:hypothetical protein
MMNMDWQVGLMGGDGDLSRLATTFSEGDPRVWLQADGVYVMESSALDKLTDAVEVDSEAGRILGLMHGAMKLDDPSVRPVQPSRDFWHQGDHHRLAFPGTASGHTTVTGVAVGTVDGVSVPPPPPPERKWMAIAMSNANVADALQLISGSETWFQLYKIVEVIKSAVGGEDGIVQRGWTSRNRIRTFKATANHPALSGDDARHARQPGSGGKRSMSLQQAQALVRELIQRWLQELAEPEI